MFICPVLYEDMHLQEIMHLPLDGRKKIRIANEQVQYNMYDNSVYS